MALPRKLKLMFQHTAARRRLLPNKVLNIQLTEFQHTAARRRLQSAMAYRKLLRYVSTHSRPKAAALVAGIYLIHSVRFNTQPPEGGCSLVNSSSISPRTVSTHSRPKAAAFCSYITAYPTIRFQHTAARRRLPLVGVIPLK